METMCIMLSADASIIRIFLKNPLDEKFQLINDLAALNNFNDLFIIKKNKALLESLIQARSPYCIYTTLTTLKNAIELDETKNAALPCLKSSICFLQEHSIDNLGSCSFTICISGVSGRNEPYQAHEKSLEELIQFVNENCSKFYNNNKSFTAGYEYQKMSWFNPSWVKKCLSENQDEYFNQGRAFAKYSEKLK